MLTQLNSSQLVLIHRMMNRYMNKDIVDTLMITLGTAMTGQTIGIMGTTDTIITEIIKIDHSTVLRTKRVAQRDTQTGVKKGNLIHTFNQVEGSQAIENTHIITNSKKRETIITKTTITTGPIWTINT